MAIPVRVHLAGLGCPVAGDRRYGARSDPCGRLALHAGAVALLHPVTGEPWRLISLLPQALRKLFPEAMRVADRSDV